MRDPDATLSISRSEAFPGVGFRSNLDQNDRGWIEARLLAFISRHQNIRARGDSGESNPGPAAPKAAIIPLDHYPNCCNRQKIAGIITTRTLQDRDATNSSISGDLNCAAGAPDFLAPFQSQTPPNGATKRLPGPISCLTVHGLHNFRYACYVLSDWPSG